VLVIVVLGVAGGLIISFGSSHQYICVLVALVGLDVLHWVYIGRFLVNSITCSRCFWMYVVID